MKAKYRTVFFTDGKEIEGSPITVELPFKRVSARALIIRRSDGAILGALHRPDGGFALPGGGIDDGENSFDAIERELEEENITLMGSDTTWRERIAVDYYEGFRELTIWHVFIVDEAEVGHCEENLETRWISPGEDVWHPFMHEKIALILKKFFPELAKVTLSVYSKNGT